MLNVVRHSRLMDFRLQVVPSIAGVSAGAWDLCAGTHPFTRHVFLGALESSGAVGRDRGVLPRYALLYDENSTLVACAPAMLKWGTLREYGPEALWLKQGLVAGCFAGPKFQLGVPFFPSVGPRVLVRPGFNSSAIEVLMLRELQRAAPKLGAPASFNVMYVDEVAAKSLEQAGALVSCEQQSIWLNADYVDLQDYLGRLPERKRSRFVQERRYAEAKGLRFLTLHGDQITKEMMDSYYEGHELVCMRHGNHPWLPAATYKKIVEVMGESACLFGYFDDQSKLVAGILALRDEGAGVLYLLQWSELVNGSGLAMDLICRRPIDYAIAHGLAKVDSGLAARHKTLRGWLTLPVFHGHWFNNAQLKSLAETTLQAG